MARKTVEEKEVGAFDHMNLPVGKIVCGQETAGGNVKISKRDYGETKASEPSVVDVHGNPA